MADGCRLPCVLCDYLGCQGLLWAQVPVFGPKSRFSPAALCVYGCFSCCVSSCTSKPRLLWVQVPVSGPQASLFNSQSFQTQLQQAQVNCPPKPSVVMMAICVRQPQN